MNNYTLVIAEKPSVAKDLAKVLGCAKGAHGYYQNQKYIVTWALGHLVTMSAPEEYNSNWEKWQLENLPMLPTYLKTTVIKQTSHQFRVVKELLHKKEVTNLIIATDAGREGELVARLIIEKAGVKKPTKRLWVSSMTDSALQKGFRELKDACEYDLLFESAKARMMADWLVGLNVTRALTCKYNAQLSAGRVQTPTLALIFEREQEINRFLPKPYYQITLLNQKTVFTYQDSHRQSNIFNKDIVNKIFSEVQNKQLEIVKINKTPQRVAPPLLFDLTELQRVANQKYGFSPKRTLDITQSLYEHHKLLTYPRTDSAHLPSDYVSEIAKIFNKLKVLTISKNIVKVAQGLNNNIGKNKRIFDSNKVSDHHAIIPTDNNINLNYLNDDEYKIYVLVVKRFVSAFMNDYEFDKTEVLAKVGQHYFSTTGHSVTKLGYREESGNEDEETASLNDKKLPPYQVGEKYKFETKLNELKTAPPTRYTEATLLTAMEHPGRFVDDVKMKSILEQTSGLGTPATRADIIEKLFSSGYVELAGKNINITKKGRQLVCLVPSDLKSPLLTAQFEDKLKQITNGKVSPKTFFDSIIDLTKTLTEAVINQNNKYQHDNLITQLCPTCGNKLLEINNKGRIMHQCMERCGYKKTIKMLSNARCPKCHKRLTLYFGDEQEKFICVCGFKIKKELFIEELTKNKNELSKVQVKQYLQKQQDDVPNDNPFSAFWAESEDSKKK